MILIVEKLTKKFINGILAGVFLGFSRIVWSQAVIVEVYTLFLLFISLLTYIFLKFIEYKNKKYIYLSCFLLGLGLSNHILIFVFIPAYIYFLFKKNLKIFKPKIIFLMLFFFFLPNSRFS